MLLSFSVDKHDLLLVLLTTEADSTFEAMDPKIEFSSRGLPLLSNSTYLKSSRRLVDALESLQLPDIPGAAWSRALSRAMSGDASSAHAKERRSSPEFVVPLLSRKAAGFPPEHIILRNGGMVSIMVRTEVDDFSLCGRCFNISRTFDVSMELRNVGAGKKVLLDIRLEIS